MPKTKPAPAAAPEPAQAEEAAPAQEPAEQEPQRPPTSRICVKNLPKYVDDRRLREHFAAKGEVTDSKVMRTRDGKSRCFGFVGFRTPADAEAAVKYFDRSFFDTMRLAVEFAYKAGSGAAPRAWSKYTEGTSAHKRLAAPEKTGANAQPLGAGADGAAAGQQQAGKKGKRSKEPLPEEADPKLREFLSVMQPRSKQAFWANDDLTAPGSLAAAAAGGQQQQQRGKKMAAAAADEEGGSDDEYEDLPAAAAGGTPSSSDGGSGSEEEEEEDEEGSGEQQEGDGLVRNAAVSDLDYLKSRVKANFDDDEDAWAAGGSADAGGSSSDEDAEEEEEEASGSEEEEEQAAAGGSGSDGEPAAAASKQQRGRRKAADAADAELDAIFGGDGGGLESEGEDAGAEAEEVGEGQEASDADADMADAAEAEERQQAGAGQGPAATVVQAGDEASIADTGRLFVRNLPYTATEAELQELFEQYGSVSEVHLVLDRASKKSKGFALVQFGDPQDAVKAHAELDGSIFQGRLIHILPGKRPPAPAEPAEGEGEDGKSGKAGTSSYKEKKEAELKAGAGNRSAWNTLFMRADTVAEAVAAHFGVSKSELLDREAGDLAVRVALGETHVIAETKRALGEAGADVTKLEAAASAGGKAAASKAVARSDSVLVVKNLPFSASQEELETLFGAVGPLGRLVLPPTRTLALVEFLEAQDARRAFKSLAYKRYQHVPLYLEWAPKGIFSSPPPPRSAPAAAAKAGPAAAPAAAAGKNGATAAAAPAAAAAAGKSGKASKAKAGAAAAPEAELLTGLAEAQAEEAESSSIFVKNLAWGTEEAALRKHFDAAVSSAGGAVRAVKIAKKKGPDGKQLSAGFGFVECSSEAAAKAAVKALQGSSLDGHKLVLQLSQKKPAAAAAAGGKRKVGMPDTSKMVVRNVAFEATRKDIMGLFTPFGQIKSCRLPRKFDGTHRGFAFVDFATKQEARNAMEAVQGAHLYGRRLVLEWAEEEGGLDELRAKTAAKYRGEAELEGAAAPAAAEPAQQRQKKRQKTKK